MFQRQPQPQPRTTAAQTDPPTQATPRKTVDVAVGVLIDQEQRFLLTSRPAGKVYAGYWEFPGGKIEAGESVQQALARELHEELGIAVGAAPLWRVEEIEYPHARVRLHFCKVHSWAQQPQPREGQQLAWQTLPVHVAPVLPGTIPVLNWMAQEQHWLGPTHLHSPSSTPAGQTEPAPSWLDQVKWDAQGLVPAIAQEASSGDVLMMAWMNRDALLATAQRGQAVYYSRSRQRLWHKGEESGHFQRVHELRMDCDNDVVLLKVTQLGSDPGVACHTGRHSCFYQRLEGNQHWQAVEPVLVDPERLYRT